MLPPEAVDGTATSTGNTSTAMWPPPWGFLVASTAPGVSLALVGYRFWSGPQRYSQFIAGALGWSGGSKPQDFALLFCFIAGFLASLAALLTVAERLRKRLGPDAADDLHSLTIYASLPLALWLGPLLLTRHRSLVLAHVATVLVLAILTFAAVASVRSRRWSHSAVFDSVGGSVAVLLLAWLSGLAVAVSAVRIGVTLGIPPAAARAELGTISSALAASTAAVLLVVLWWRAGRASAQSWPALHGALSIAQAAIPGFFLFVLPTPWLDGHVALYPPQMRPVLWIGLAALMLLALADLVWRARPSGGLWSRVSPLCLVAILIFLKVPPTTPSIPVDDYHFGEFVTPWWSWWSHGMLPYWDFVPPRGLINYLSGFLSTAFFDGTAASVMVALPFEFALVLLVSFPLIARVTGPFAAFVGLLFVPPAHTLSEAELLLSAALCLLGWGYGRWAPGAWLLAWIGTGVLAVLVATGQGGLLVLATLLPGAVMAVRAWRSHRFVLPGRVAVAAAVALVVGWLTPLRRMVLGAIRYGAEQSSVNDIAHGIPWAASHAVPFANPITWEAVRASWIVVALIAGTLLVAGWRRTGTARRAAIPFVLPVFLLTLLYVVRAAGRIDPDGITRLGYTSLWMVGILLPVVLLASSDSRRRPGVSFAVLAICGLLLPHTQMRDLTDVMSRATEAVPAPPVAADVTLPNLGRAFVDPAHLARLRSLQQQLDLLVDPGETYLDLTNRNAQYFYLDRKPPIETAAVYNLVDERQQQRAIASLLTVQPPVVLADADSIRHDGGSTAYRSHLLYRYVVKHYLPVAVDRMVLLVLPTRLQRLPVDARAHTIEPTSRFDLLDRVFGQERLGLLPVSWGRSRATLDAQLRLARRLNGPAALSEVVDEGGAYRPTGGNPSVILPVSSPLASGAEAGMLSFDFTCEGGGGAIMDITWSDAAGLTRPVRLSARDGHLIVPLDASPRWLLAERIASIRLSLIAPKCTRFTIRDAALSQRRVVDRTPGL
jgi:hypothetical protein